MTTLTPKYAIPYPDAGDPPANPLQMKAMADRVELLLDQLLADTGWLDCSIGAGFAAMGGTEKPQARQVGSVVWVRGGFLATGMAVNGTYTLGALPAGITPPPVNDIRAVGSSTGAASAASGFVQTGGELSLRTGATLGAYYRFDRSYRVG